MVLQGNANVFLVKVKAVLMARASRAFQGNTPILSVHHPARHVRAVALNHRPVLRSVRTTAPPEDTQAAAQGATRTAMNYARREDFPTVQDFLRMSNAMDDAQQESTQLRQA